MFAELKVMSKQMGIKSTKLTQVGTYNNDITSNPFYKWPKQILIFKSRNANQLPYSATLVYNVHMGIG